MTRKPAILLGVSISFILGAGFWALDYFWLAPTPIFSPPQIVSIKQGEPVRTIARELARRGIVRSSFLLLAYAELTGKATRVQPGDYAFKGGERTPDVLRHLVDGDSMVVVITIPEGMTVHQIAERLENAGLSCDNQFEQAARRGSLVQALGLGPLGAEGYLSPATYRFSPFAGSGKILATMLARFYEILTPAVEQRMFESGIDTRELVTLASIVEKEAKVAGERPLIAGVFYNRLRLGMPLQSDPTAQYSFDEDALPAAVAVHTPSPFNTYTIIGLPPGPIANPGLSSIEAVLYPAATDYLYFVARHDGTHVFSRSFKEHEHAIAAIRRSATPARSAAATVAARRRQRTRIQ
jgi:peptidoglycan lytic transglycosylase G